MKTGVVIALVIGGLALLYFAVSRGLIKSGVQVGVGPGGVTGATGIVAPQPSQNYSGFLAASTAPGVASALNGIFTGIGGAFGSWLNPARTAPAPPAPAQGAVNASPTIAAQPQGPAAGAVVAASDAGMGWMIGPSTDSQLAYNATSGSAFDYAGLSSDNAFDPSASLESYATA